MKSYVEIVKQVMEHGENKSNRTGIGARTVTGCMFKHDMSNGFPLLTGKRMPFKTIATELSFFLKGLTDKHWLHARNCYIWDEWASPSRVPYGHSEEARKLMMAESDLGPIYGYQWRHYGQPYDGKFTDYSGQGIDQLGNLVRTLKDDPTSRRMLVTAWNPQQLPQMALPPCHYAFQVTVNNGKLNLLWSQRSVDTMLGLPFNIAEYGLLLHLLARETGLQEGELVGFLADVHIYENHLAGAERYLDNSQRLYGLPIIETPEFTSIFDWEAADSRLVGYHSYGKIDFEIAV